MFRAHYLYKPRRIEVMKITAMKGSVFVHAYSVRQHDSALKIILFSI
ncbi:hypothetical protein VRK_40370 [Vibrio sp. MEBiC08052]|nr:hypothetical protein VRK_40370 [Vibrio sp. MEBiC08052]